MAKAKCCCRAPGVDAWNVACILGIHLSLLPRFEVYHKGEVLLMCSEELVVQLFPKQPAKIGSFMAKAKCCCRAHTADVWSVVCIPNTHVSISPRFGVSLWKRNAVDVL